MGKTSTYRSLRAACLLCLILCIPASLRSEDYNYDYFHGDKEKYVPFSDYIPKSRLHFKTVPHYLEDYYELYGLKEYYNENTLRKNIDRLKTALNCKFRHPSMALVKVETEKEYEKYRNLLFMHINLLIMRNQMTIASRYDKQRIYFFNLDFAREIRESLNTADQYYGEAEPYWQRAREYARKASAIKITTLLSFMESERYSIIRGELDFGKIIQGHRDKVTRKKKELDQAIQKRS